MTFDHLRPMWTVPQEILARVEVPDEIVVAIRLGWMIALGDCGGGRIQTFDRTNHSAANWQSSGSGHSTIPICFVHQGGLRMCGPPVAGHDRHPP